MAHWKLQWKLWGIQRTFNVFPLRSPPRTVWYSKKRGAINAPHENDLSVFLPLVRASVPSSKRVVLLVGKFLSPCSGAPPSGSILLSSQLHRYSSTNEPESNCCIEGVLPGKALDFQILEILTYRQQLRECPKNFFYKGWMNCRRAWRRCPWWYKYIEGFLRGYSNTSHRALLIKGKCTSTHSPLPTQLSLKM